MQRASVLITRLVPSEPTLVTPWPGHFVFARGLAVQTNADDAVYPTAPAEAPSLHTHCADAAFSGGLLYACGKVVDG